MRWRAASATICPARVRRNGLTVTSIASGGSWSSLANCASISSAVPASRTSNFCPSASYPIVVTAAPTKVYPYVAAIGPTQVRKRLRERRDAKLPLRIVFVAPHEHGDAPHAALLRACGKRPCRRAAEERGELAPPHWITSSTRTRI